MHSISPRICAAGILSALAWMPVQSSGFVPPHVHLRSNARVSPLSSFPFLSLPRLVRPLPLQLRATAAGPAASQRNDEDEETRRRRDVWGHTWYPLHFEQHADKTAPSACTLLGASVVFWWDPIAEEWAAALDVCPHRLVPLSEGRVCPKSGGIECPYHGWTFQGSDGACTRIPQLEPGKKINQRRARATALPVRVRAGILWCWAAKLVSSDAPPDEGKLDSLQVDCIGKPGVLNLDYFRDLPMDATILTENVLDPSHLPYTHHKTISSRGRAAPMSLCVQGQITKEGFTSLKGAGAGKTNKESEGGGGGDPTLLGGGVRGGVKFTAPHHVLSVTHRPDSFSDWNVVYAVPQGTGRCRLFVRVVFQVSAMSAPMSWIFNVAFRLPQWYTHLSNHRILEDDNIFLHKQERTLRNSPMPGDRAKVEPSEEGGGAGGEGKGGGEGGRLAPNWQERYFLPSQADALVVAYRLWLDRFSSGKGAFASPLAGGRAFGGGGRGAGGGGQGAGAGEGEVALLTRAQLVERLESHTRQCKCCRDALGRFETLLIASQFAAVASLAVAVLLGKGAGGGVFAVVALVWAAVGCGCRMLVKAFQVGRLVPPRNVFS